MINRGKEQQHRLDKGREARLRIIKRGESINPQNSSDSSSDSDEDWL